MLSHAVLLKTLKPSISYSLEMVEVLKFFCGKMLSQFIGYWSVIFIFYFLDIKSLFLFVSAFSPVPYVPIYPSQHHFNFLVSF